MRPMIIIDCVSLTSFPILGAFYGSKRRPINIYVEAISIKIIEGGGMEG